MNCFELCIFERLNTTHNRCTTLLNKLWIALNYVSLKDWIQLLLFIIVRANSCELLWIMYLWKIEYNFFERFKIVLTLWIALNYVSLKDWIQHKFTWKRNIQCCELLWIMYLWKIEYNQPALCLSIKRVVNCFELCIFERLNTTDGISWWSECRCELLWIMYLWKIEYNTSLTLIIY